MVVSIRRMTAGNGYKYVLKTVVAGDGDRSLSTPLTRYYAGETTHVLKLFPITADPPIRVIEILPPSGLIGPDSLEVTVFGRTNPYLGPCRRYDQRDAPLFVAATKRGAVGIEIDEPASMATPPPAGHVGGDSPQACHGVRTR